MLLRALARLASRSGARKFWQRRAAATNLKFQKLTEQSLGSRLDASFASPVGLAHLLGGCSRAQGANGKKNRQISKH
jgi:hypothetical protein